MVHVDTVVHPSSCRRGDGFLVIGANRVPSSSASIVSEKMIVLVHTILGANVILCVDILDYFNRINVDSARIVGVTSPGSLTKYSGTSPYGHLTSKKTSPLQPPWLSPKLYSRVNNPL